MHTKRREKKQSIHNKHTYTFSLQEKRVNNVTWKKSADSEYAELIIRFGEWFNHKQLLPCGKIHTYRLYWPTNLCKVFVQFAIKAFQSCCCCCCCWSFSFYLSTNGFYYIIIYRQFSYNFFCFLCPLVLLLLMLFYHSLRSMHVLR